MRFPNSFAFFFVSFNFFSWVWGTILKTLYYEFLNSVHSIYLCTLCNISCLSCNNRRQTECKMSLSLRFVFSILKVITNACILCYLLNSNVFFLRIINKCNNLNISSRRTKGQLISKGTFSVFNSPKKRTKTTVVKSNFFLRFLGEM